MPETYGSFEALLHKLENYEGWDGEICIKTRTYEHHVPTNHYYKRKFNAERSRESGNLEVDIEGEDGQLYRDLSITFEDLKDAKYLISASNFSANNIECQGITPGFWWIYEETPRINAKGGKRRKTRRKRGKGKVFSSLKQLYETLANDQHNPTKIFFKIGNDGFVKEGTLLYLAGMYAEKVLPVLQEGPLDLKRLKWEDLKRGDTKVKKEQDEDWWQYYEEGAKGGRKKTRKKRGKGGVFSRRRRRPTRVTPAILIGDNGNPEPVATTAIEVQNYELDQLLSEINNIRNQMTIEYNNWVEAGSVRGPFYPISPLFTQLEKRQNELLTQYYQKLEPSAEIVAYPGQAIGGRRKNKTRKCKNKWSISTNFDAGNIIKKRCETINDINIYTLQIKKDPYPKFTRKKYQNWYYFQVNNVKGKKCKFIIENLVNIDNDWKGHKVVYTYDHKCFYRHSTTLNEKQNYITWNFTPKKNKIWFSYYIPYSRKRVYDLNHKLSKRKNVNKIILGKSSLNNKIELLRFGKGLKHIFMIARQHPGETIGSWMLEGFLKSLFSTSFKKQTNILFNKFTFHIISMVNPDGVQLGHWYTQKHGHNCNREWVKKTCPEVKMIYKYMKQYKGCLYFDFHGDEGCKKHFFTTCDRTKKDKNSSWNFFRNRMKHYNKYFDKEDYYKKAAHNVHGTFDCAWDNALTLEGCMKHNYNNEELTLEPLRIGKHLYKCIYDWSFIV